MMRHTLRKTDGNYQVGFFSPTGQWAIIAEVENLEQAAALTSYLNGGDRPTESITPK
jgi:hypothetical protein